jgi:CHAD domain-containing protein
MAFTLDPAPPLDETIRLVARKQWRRVGSGLAGDVTVHETRKAVKRLRALGALLRPLTGRRATRKLDHDLRDIGRALAHRRDAEVLCATWITVGKEMNLSASVIAAGEAAIRRTNPASTTVPKGALQALAKRTGQRLDGLPVDGLTFDDLIPGARRTYREGRRRFAEARSKDTSEAYHDWRKAVQRHFRQMGLLGALWPDVMSAHATAARDLSQTIGEEHDLALLAIWVGGPDAPPEVAAVAKRVVAHLDKRCAMLRRRACREGRRVFAETPKAFARRLSIYVATMAPAGPGARIRAPIEARIDA